MTHHDHIINLPASLSETLNRLNALSDGNLTLIAVDGDGKLRGTITDGDIRRALLKGVALTDSIEKAIHFPCIRVTSLPDRATANAYLQQGIKLLPVVTADEKLIEIIDLRDYRPALPVAALIMAGGRGERLNPATLTTPKPLLPVGGKPIIDYVISLLRDNGVENITVACRYLAEQLISHFADTDVKCVVETHPLGTIGALAMMDTAGIDNILVMNCDLLTTADISSMVDFHLQRQAAVTIATIPYTVQIPYAILQTEGATVKSLQEKPVYTFYANAGIYLLSKSVIDMITPGERIDATDLIELAISRNMNVVSFPLNGTWVDIGTPADFAYAEQLLAK